MSRFASLVDTGEKMEAFNDKYGISAEVTIEHCKIGKHYTRRPTGVVAIPMITFIEGRMRIPMDRVMHDFLLFFRTSHSLCSINLFKIVNNVARIIKKMNMDLTHHNINSIYICQDSKVIGYYLRMGNTPVRLISCLLENNKGLDNEFLIISRIGTTGSIASFEMGSQVRSVDTTESRHLVFAMV